MKTSAGQRSNFATAAGPRLRCFLGSSLIPVVLLLCAPASANANVCVSETFHVSRVQGHVTDQYGEVLPTVRITLKKSGIVVLESTTDDKGDFHLKVSPGEYELLFEARGFALSGAPLKVGFGLRSIFRSNRLYLALAVSSEGCAPNLTTSYKEYKRQIRAFEPRFGEDTKDYATQK
jgi:hypothetical protein